jgi:transposase-like protein
VNVAYADYMQAMPTSEPECVSILANLRWGSEPGDAPTCYKCGSTNASKSPRTRLWNCRGCRSQFSVTQGTFLARAHLDLPDWFAGIEALLRFPDSTTGVQSVEALLPFKTMKLLKERFGAALADSDPLATALKAFITSTFTEPSA